MAFRVSTFLACLVLLLPFVVANSWSRHHQEVAHRARGDVDLHKRQSFTGARFTFYDVGLGACGAYSQPSDFIVALNVDQYGGGYPGPQCWKSITIQYNGLTAVATIVDECMGCPYGGLDFSEGLFKYFAETSVGVIYGTWWFNGGSGGGGGGNQPTTTTPTTTWQPAPTSTPDYTPTTSTPDYTPPTTSSSAAPYTPTTTTTSSKTWTTSTSSTPSTSSTSSNYNTGQDSGLTKPTGVVVSTPDPSHPQNIFVISEVLVEVGAILKKAAE